MLLLYRVLLSQCDHLSYRCANNVNKHTEHVAPSCFTQYKPHKVTSVPVVLF